MTIARKKATELARVALAYFDGAFAAAHSDGGVEVRRLLALLPARSSPSATRTRRTASSVGSHAENVIVRCTQRRRATRQASP
jgi:hypothetical protein